MVSNNTVNELVDALSTPQQSSNNVYNAVVANVDNEGVVWVHVEGSSKVTPTASRSAEVSQGDHVSVEWRNNKLYIAGNYSSPSAGVVRVANVEQTANNAQATADVAFVAANNAVADAERAATAATSAEAYASQANVSANSALVQLSVIEDVAGTLEWISKHGTYTLTTDTTVHEGTVYFVKNGNDYTPIAEPTGNPYSQGWYVLDVTDSQSDFIMAHLAVTTRGLWVLPSGLPSTNKTIDNSVDKNTSSDTTAQKQANANARQADNYKVLLSNNGMYLYDGTGRNVTTYGESITFDSSRPQYIGNANTYIKYYDSNNDSIADSIEIAGSNVSIASSVTIGGMPTKVSDLQNDSDFATEDYVDDAHDDAAKTATSYIANIDSQNGITIKALLGETSGTDVARQNYIKLNANDGMEVFKGGVSVAKYSNTMRVGKAESYHTEVDDDGFRLIDSSQTPVMDVAYSGEERQDQRTAFDFTMANQKSTPRSLSRTLPIDATKGATVTFTATDSEYTGLDSGTSTTWTDTFTVPTQPTSTQINLGSHYVVEISVYATTNPTLMRMIVEVSGYIPAITSMRFIATITGTYYVPSLSFIGVASFNDNVFIQGKKLTYDAGDAITNTIWYGSGFLTSSSTEIYFTLPLSRVITASSVTVTSLNLITRQNNKYTHGSASSTRVTWTPISATITPSGVRIGASCSTTTNAINNDVIGINAQISLEFS